MGNLRIKKINYRGNDYHFNSPIFEGNLILIEGDNGTGKSTFCNLIYYGLGGRVNEFSRTSKGDRHKEITNDRDNYVELYISINSENYKLVRHIDDNDITISSYVEASDIKTKETFLLPESEPKPIVLPIYRTPETKTIFSDWILSELDISVVELYQGYTSFKINFNDLLRLIYHDQQPDPNNIYKKLDTKSNFLNDSELLRKAIFELLIGKTFSEYYDSIAKTKSLEKDKNIAKGLLQEYSRIIEELSESKDPSNIIFLQNELQEKEQQLEKLHESRIKFKINRELQTPRHDYSIDDLKDELFNNQMELSNKNEKLITLINEKQKISHIKETTLRELSQIAKIIHSHEQLNLFSAETCPYCLEKVERATGHCVCGSEINEEQYQRFFYTAKEYKDIYNSKAKTIHTIDIAGRDCDHEITKTQQDINNLRGNIQKTTEKISENIENIDSPFDINTINDIDDKILDARQDIEKIRQRIEAESKQDALRKNYDTKRSEHNLAEQNTKKLEAEAKIDINSKVEALSKIYDKLMTESLPDCNSARVNLDNYQPNVDEGIYREASSAVSKRLMYYLALMKLSLSDDSVPFPRFLLIDTPETSGIELEYLKRCLSKISELNIFNKSYQVILTTGLNKYPESFKENRKIFLPDKQHRLLIKN